MYKTGRKSNRLKGYDYSLPGFYFVTICINDRKDYFGEIRNAIMGLNEYGCIANQCWQDLPNHYYCKLDEYIIMPNHFHGIIEIIENENDFVRETAPPSITSAVVSVGAGLKPVPTDTTDVDGKKRHGLSEIIRGFKTFSSRRINEKQNHFRFRWQRSFYDHIIRDDESYIKIQDYINDNPLKWQIDRDFYEKYEKFLGTIE